MSNYVVLRLLDSFFRHKFLHILPVLAFTALGAWYVATQQVEYQAKGVLLVEDETLLTSLSGVGGDGGGFVSPASRVSTELNSLLQTESFVKDIAESAGFGSDLSSDEIVAIQRSLGSYPVGENLVQVFSDDIDAENARAKAAATIDSLIQFQIDSAVGDSAAAEGVLDPLTEEYRRDLLAARQSLEEYVRGNPARGDGTRSAGEQLRIDQLTAILADANARYTEALDKEESAQLAARQAESAIRNRFQIVDSPSVPTSPVGRLRTRALALAVFISVGVIMTAASIVLGAVLDQSLRYPLDVTTRVGVKVLGVIPDTSAWTGSWTSRDQSGDGSPDDQAMVS